MVERVLFYLLCVLFYSTAEQQLLVSNNGPAVLDGSITFSALLLNYTISEDLCYFFSDGIQNYSIKSVKTSVTLTCYFVSNLYTPGAYLMNSYVTDCDSQDKISSNNTEFFLQEYLIGELIVNRDIEDLNDNQVAVGENVSMAVQLYDPNAYIHGAKMSYTWSIDYEPQPFVHSNITYIYHSARISRIVSMVSAQLENNIFKFGMFSKKLNVEVPVNSVNVSGKTFLYHGDILSLNISCSGSSPFRYCARPLKPDEVASNFSCNPIVSTTCSFHIQQYFRNYGNYQYGMIISNDVKTVKKIIDILVYNRSKTPQLSTVIMPIVCSLITLCIIAGGIAYCIQHHNQFSIEVANFDFQEDSVDSHAPVTFFEKIFLSCSCHVCGRGSADCDELNDGEDEPLIGSSAPNLL